MVGRRSLIDAEFQKEKARAEARQAVLDARGETDDEGLMSLLEIVAERMFDDDFSLTRLREHPRLSKRIFDRFHAAFGTTLEDYVLRCRMNAAAWLVKKAPLLPIYKIARFMGYSAPQTFSAAFKRIFHKTPREVRQAIDCEVHERKATHMAREVKFTILVSSKRWFDVLWASLKRHALEVQSDLLIHISCDPEAFFHFLCDKSREEGRRDRATGIAIMKLASHSLELNFSLLEDTYFELAALAHARLGNAHRLALDYSSAEAAFRLAEEFSKRNISPGAEAEVLWLKGTLRLYRRDFQSALPLLHEATALSRVGKNLKLEMNCLIQRCRLYAYLGRNLEAIRDLTRELDRIATIDDDRLKVVFYSTLAHVYGWSGDYNNTLAAVAEAERYYDEQVDSLAKWQLIWLKGIAQYELENLDEAERLFANSYAGFRELGEPDHASVVAIELSVVRFQKGAVGEAIQLASEALLIFERLDIVPDGLAAYQILGDGLGHQQLTREALCDAQQYLRNLLIDPARSGGAP